VMCLATQSPSDVLGSPLARTLIEQTPTKVFFPNVDASRDYVEGFGLSEREYALIKDTMTPGSRQFLVKQGAHSVVAQLDLKGFNSELAVISGRAQTVELMRRLIDTFGDDPDAWLTPFLARVLANDFGPLDPWPSFE
jgi:type IV secretion system protein VirB4